MIRDNRGAAGKTSARDLRDAHVTGKSLPGFHRRAKDDKAQSFTRVRTCVAADGLRLMGALGAAAYGSVLSK